MNTKPCRKCKSTDRYTDGRCKSCSRSSCKTYGLANKGPTNNRRAEKYRKAHPERCRAAIRKWRYGITEEQWQALYTAQKGLCAICEVTFSDERKSTKAHVDHCHKTDAIRGLLCDSCNTGLGRFHDNPETLKKAIDYLTCSVLPTVFSCSWGFVD